jgi:hypothetical protein
MKSNSPQYAPRKFWTTLLTMYAREEVESPRLPKSCILEPTRSDVHHHCSFATHGHCFQPGIVVVKQQLHRAFKGKLESDKDQRSNLKHQKPLANFAQNKSRV